MKTFDFIQATISHNLKNPHSKTLEPDCVSPFLVIKTQSLDGEGWRGRIRATKVAPTHREEMKCSFVYAKLNIEDSRLILLKAMMAYGIETRHEILS
jgi:hypothetical protein